MKSLPPEVLAKYLEGPSSVPPPNVVPNLENPPNRNALAVAIGTLSVAIASTALALRLYSRIFIMKKLRIEDYLGTGAFLSYIGVIWAFFYYRQKAGFFVHQWDLPGHIVIDLGYIYIVIGVSYCVMMALLKSAILLEWNRLFVLNRTHRPFYWCSVVLLVINAGTYTASAFALAFTCRPVRKLWYFWLPGHCIDRKKRDVANAGFNVAIDLFLLLLPQKIIWGLHMSRSRQAGLSLVFAVGLLVNVCAIGRLYTTATLPYADPELITRPFDTTYLFSQTLLWAITEAAGIFLVFSVTAFPKIFTEHQISSKIKVSLPSWARMSPLSSSKKSDHIAWPQTIGSAPNKPRRHTRGYQLTDEDMGPQNSATELTALPAVFSDHIPYRNHSGIGIMKTVEVDHDDAASRISSTNVIDLQHPWMGR